MMKTTLEIPDDLFDEASRYAASRGESFLKIVETGLRRLLDSEPQSAAGFRLRKHAFSGQGLTTVAMTQESIRRKIYDGRGE
ncbi:MAG: hypothetical protein ABI165_00975 [Bryobacteraceae bacterium]